jgi:hypothetical protein
MLQPDQNAKNILAVVKSGERTAASAVECNEVFKEMETEARFIKKHFLLIPPLTLAGVHVRALGNPAGNRPASGRTPRKYPDRGRETSL